MGFERIFSYRNPLFFAAQEIKQKFPQTQASIFIEGKKLTIKMKKRVDIYSLKEIEAIAKKHFPSHQVVLR